MRCTTHLDVLVLGTALALTTAAPAFAAPLELSYSETAAGTTGAGTVTDATLGGTYTYGNSFGNLTTALYTPSSGSSAGIDFEFYDDYVFTIDAAAVNSVTSTINLGNVFAVDNLQARLYDATSQSSLPVLGTPVGGVIEDWSSSVSGGGNVMLTILDNVSLASGTYVLEIRGSVSGSSGGSYAGVMNVAPVPLPAALWLFGSALAGVAASRRRRG